MRLIQAGEVKDFWRARGADAAALTCIVCFFAAFFASATYGDRFLVGGDAFAYSYPLRTIAWEMLRRGKLPLWTPAILSGYPLLSMAQVSLGYPLTWGYLWLPGRWAEQLYVLAPFVLAPCFTYAYAREIGRSRLAALFAGLTYGYGGMMTNLLGVVGLMSNALLWLPLLLLALERSRRRAFVPCLLGATGAYAMSVLTGFGQGFVFVALVAGAYALFLALFAHALPAAQGTHARARANAWWIRWRPVLVAAGAVALAAGLAAFQILETLRAVRRSIRSVLIYPFFISGSFTWRIALKALLAPLYIERFADVTNYVSPLALILSVVACVCAVRRSPRDVRIFFWATVALIAWGLMLGEHTPLYPLLYHVPIFNSFRVPSRHAFEWTFALSMLAAYGWDACGSLLARGTGRHFSHWHQTLWRGRLVTAAMLAAGVFVGARWWAATERAAVRTFDAATGVPQAWVAGQWYLGLPLASYLWWKAVFTLLTCCLIWAGWRLAEARWRGCLLAGALLLVCFVEPFILVSQWWWPFVKPAARFNTPATATRWLQRAAPATGRVYTRADLFAEEFVATPRLDPPNLTMLYGLANVGGYEPLMLTRYSRALGDVTLDAVNPLPGHGPTDSLFAEPSHVLDLLNTRYVVVFDAVPNTPAAPTEKQDKRLAVSDLSAQLRPGETLTLIATAARADRLLLVTSLANSTVIEDGTIVARVRIHGDDGRVVERALRAGVETAEWAHERPDVRAAIRHSLAPIFDRNAGDAQNSFPAYRYQASLSLGEPLSVQRVDIMNVTTQADLFLSKAVVDDAQRGFASALQRSQKAFFARLDAHRWRPVFEQDGALIYENERALPPVWLVPEAETVTDEEALRRIRGESVRPFDPRRTALLEVTPEALPTLPGGGALPESAARVMSHEPTRLMVETNAATPTVLVISEVNYPGWRATIDEQPTAILVTDFLLRGVLVPAGRHEVVLRYTAPAAFTGALISAFTLALLGGLALYAWRKSRLTPTLPQGRKGRTLSPP